MSVLENDSLTKPTQFSFGDIELRESEGEVRLHYSYDNGIKFCEIISFGSSLPAATSARRAEFDAAILALHVAAGVSYFKAFVPGKIAFERPYLSRNQLQFFQKLYRNGLGEFAFRNNIDIAERVDFLANPHNAVPEQSIAGAAPASPAEGSLPRRSAVLLGGGKDSAVSIEILRAISEPMVLFSVNPKQPMLDCAKASELPFKAVTRKIDPAIFELNASGAYNGHVPITSIVSLIAIAAAFVDGYDAVVLSNERSADEGNLISKGIQINHQYSKTSEFEEDLRDYVTRYISKRLSYFSLLRPLSELHIARLMAKTRRYDDYFTSCNRAFRLRPTEVPARWCGNCPKCRFTFMILATAMEPNRLMNIFGRNLLDDPTQLAGYEELVGLIGNKPWECVGEIAESALAIGNLASRPSWADCFVVANLAPRLSILIDDAPARWRSLLTPSHDHNLPLHFEDAFHAYLAGG
jgi:UDP-N-acetyl-alpha-D-muramoyl-L-alanyl-L-glutamate epimerase